MHGLRTAAHDLFCWQGSGAPGALLVVPTGLARQRFVRSSTKHRIVFAASLLVAAVLTWTTSTMAADTPPPEMAIQGQFDVDSSGAASYSIPIAVPPGTAKMVPSLSLSYSSGGGDGIVGYGWSLGGLSTITRCPRTYAQDSVHGGVNFDGNDRFCLNGHRLMAISGSYGADGTQYRTELDEFSKVISYGAAGTGPAYFKVWMKSGQIVEFGHSTDSAIQAVGKSSIRVWAANRVSDAKGNYYAITYTNDQTNGQYYPVRIDYTGNTGLTPFNSVQFVYNTARPDVVPAYQAGSMQQLTVLLTNIKTYQGATLVRDYQLTYRLGSNTTHSRLTTVALCDASRNCLAPTTFTWQGGSGLPSMTTVSVAVPLGTDPRIVTPPTQQGNNGLIAGDFNHDGLTDYVANKNTCYRADGPSFLPVMLANQNASYGETDMLIHVNTLGGTTAAHPSCFYMLTDFGADGYTDGLLAINVMQNPPDGVLTNTAFLKNDHSGNFNTVNNGTGTAGNAGDFFGDGRTSIFVQPTIQASPTYIYRGDQNLNFSLVQVASNDQGLWGGVYNSGTTHYNSSVGQGNYHNSLLVADFDGDGCADVLGMGAQWTEVDGQITVGPSPVSTLAYSCNPAVKYVQGPYPVIHTSPVGGVGPGVFVGDFNGDGKADLLIVTGSDQANSTGSLWLSTGTGFTQTSFTVPGSWGNYQVVQGDWNGDGKTDIALVSQAAGTPHLIFLSTGTGFVQVASLANGDAGAFATVADWNNDGASDLWIQKASGDAQYLFSYSPERIVSISNGIGATTAISYDRLNHGAIYTLGTGATYPISDVINASYAVSSVAKSNGAGGNNTFTYTYTGAKNDYSGRGFLGFSKMTVTDQQTAIVQTTIYRTDFPFIGKIASQTVVAPGNATLSSLTNTWTDSAEGSGVHFVGLTQSVVVRNDLDASPYPTTTTAYHYDCQDMPTSCYGNPVSMNTTVTDTSSNVVLSKSTTNTFLNDTVNWFIGRLTGKTETSTVLDTGTSGGAATGSLTASPSVITPGGTAKLTWTTSGGTSASIDNGVGNITPVSGGAVNVSPVATTTYTLTVSNANGISSYPATVTVAAAPTGTFRAAATDVGKGEVTTLIWTASNASSASIDQGVGNVSPVSSGQILTGALASTTTFTLTLTNAVGLTTKLQTTVTVHGGPACGPAGCH